MWSSVKAIRRTLDGGERSVKEICPEEAWEDDEQIERQQDLGGKLHPAPVKYRLRKKAVNIRKLEKYFLWSQTLYLLRQHLFHLNLERVWNTI